MTWRNRDALYVATDFGAGSLTSSGYPRILKEWKRGTPLGAAKTILEGKAEDVSVGAFVNRGQGKVYEFAYRSPTFFTDQTLLRRGDDWVPIEKPQEAQIHTFGEFLLLRLRTDWAVGGKNYLAGSLLAENFEDYLKGERKFTVLFEPTARKSLQDINATKNYLLLTELDNVRSRPYLLRVVDGQWRRSAVAVPEFGTVDLAGVEAEESDDYFLTMTDFLTPSTLYFGTAGLPGREKLKSLPAFFNATGQEIRQYEAVSKDGTRVPYFLVGREGLKLDGKNPTLLYGYGGV